MKGGFLSHVLGFEVTERIQEMEAASEADNGTLAFINRFGCFKLQMITLKYKRGFPFSCFRIRGHRTDLGDGGCFRG